MWFNLSAMARTCDVCQKGYKKSNSVPRGIGRRVTNRAIRRQQPNLRAKKLEVNGKTVRLNMCASCLKRIKFDQKKAAETN